MAYTFNPFSGKLDYFQPNYFQGVLASAPSTTIEGYTYINSVDNGYYIYYSGSWQLIITLAAAALSYLLLENGFTLLLEDGFKLALQ